MQRLRELLPTWGNAIPVWGVGLSSFLLCFVTFLAYYQVKFGLDEPPATSGDEAGYDSLGWELAHGRGFQIDTGDPEFRRPYEEAAKTADRFRLGRPNKAISTDRPPLYPWAISVLNRVFGRQFWAIRVMDAAFMAGTLWILAVMLLRRFGGIAVIIALVLFIAADVQTRLYGRAILTEAMSLFLTSLIVLQFVWLLELKEPTTRTILVRPLVIGAVFGLSLLARTLMVLWLPGLCLTLYWVLRQLRVSFRMALAGVAVFLVGLGIVTTPWAVRNVMVTKEFMPLGTQGLVQLSAAFGDRVWQSRGLWINLDNDDFFDEALRNSPTPLEREIQKAKFSREKAKAWIKANPWKTVLLFPLKIWQECRPRSLPELAIRLLAILGIIASWRTSLGRLLLAIFVTNFFAIGMTWSVGGRFLVPVLLPIHLFANFGALWILQGGSIGSRTFETKSNSR